MDTSRRTPKQRLPSNKDSEFWSGDKLEVDLESTLSVICTSRGKDHEFDIDSAKREVNCLKCGYGFKFQVHDVEYLNGHLIAARDFAKFSKGDRIA